MPAMDFRCLRCLCLAMCVADGLAPPRWQRLATGAIQPSGWLKTQMQLQAAALTSHLPLFWDNVQNTSWLGGNADNVGGIHESTPYWLNGAVPLAVQLQDEALLRTVEKYMDGILDRQTQEGWLGPDTDRSDFWSRYPFLMAMVQHHEALRPGARRKRIEEAALRFFAAVRQRLQGGVPLTSWSSFRAHDLIWTIHYFLDALQGSAASTTLQDLAALAEHLHSHGFDWNGLWFNSSNFAKEAVIKTSMETHGVNNAQAVKHGIVWARQSGNATEGWAETWLAWEQLQRYHGQPHGAFGADEHLAGRTPSRGTELCVVVESMWSLALASQLAPGDEEAVLALDALESLAFNALPGSLSEDLWSHPYLQFANSYQAVSNEPDHVWANDGPQAAMYGLAPNYECCTANFHQGYPKFAGSLFFEDGKQQELVSALWAPSVVNATVGLAHVELRTSYPFNTSVEYWIQNEKPFTLKIRLPKFLRTVTPAPVTVLLDGHSVKAEAVSGFLRLPIPVAARRLAVKISFAMAPSVNGYPDQGVSVYFGPLLLALDLREQRQLVQRYAFNAADWNTTATLPWRLAMPPSPHLGTPRFVAPGPRPMASNNCPVTLEATLLAVPSSAWPVRHGAPGPVNGTCRGGEQVQRTFIPYACTSIRVSALPLAGGEPVLV
ncbi:unnamed protein product [Symbiodinium natans]|uniref:Non-reducing end beta-L-arabinofuranosidase n=1 Tax=Symbiodinium natans TaxID=878477 RepID=A0A812IKQ5_9DINO|nr:unnamed protein product [Symbiodinium natans]